MGILCLWFVGPDLGWAGDHVSIEAADPVYLGATEHSALNGEQSALAWAAFWALQAPPCKVLGFSSDCETAIGQVTGRCGWKGAAELAATGRQLLQLLAAGRPAFQGDVRHVRSHQGQPANLLMVSPSMFAEDHGGTPTRTSCCCLLGAGLVPSPGHGFSLNRLCLRHCGPSSVAPLLLIRTGTRIRYRLLRQNARASLALMPLRLGQHTRTLSGRVFYLSL